MNPTTRNHYNPCFWTAHWNQVFHDTALSSEPNPLRPRDQLVNVLSVKSDKIFPDKVDNIHYDKFAGRAEISREDAEAFAQRYHPDRYEDFLLKNRSAPYPLIIDFENVFTGIEQTGAYDTLLNVIRRQEIATAEDKANLAAFLVIQLLRSHAVMNAGLEWHSGLGRPKFEHLINLKWFLSDSDALYAAVIPVAFAHWSLFVVAEHTFPLCDSPVLVSPTNVMVALSPTLLLEILPKVKASENQCRVEDHVPASKIEQFRKRTIGNTFREIIFSRQSVLKEWQASDEFQGRVARMRNMKSYNQLVAKHDQRELWLINAHGNRS